MIHHIPKDWLTFLFIEGLMKPFHIMFKVSSPRNLDDAIWVAYNLDLIVKSLKGGHMYKGPST